MLRRVTPERFRSCLLFGLLTVFVGLAAAGCGGSLKITKISTGAQRPSNVALFVDVRDSSGQPIAGLEEKNFKVYEDGKLVPTSKAKRALLEPRLGGVRYTLVLIDLSGPIADSEYRPELADSVAKMVDRVSDGQEVAVSAFDGAEEVAPFFGFGAAGDQTKALVEGLKAFKPRSRNTNLNGAVYQGLFALKEQLDASTAAKKSAALVVFTDRTDLAHSVSPQVLKQAIHDTPAEIYVIGAGEKIKNEELTAIGKSGTFLTDDPRGYKKGFDEITKKVAGKTEGRYIFSYCTTKRRGDHKMELEVVAPHDKGRTSYSFSADGFKGGCSPQKPPSFATGATPKAAPPPADSEPEGESGAESQAEPEARPPERRPARSRPAPAQAAQATDDE
jgi:hypothetical protein